MKWQNSERFQETTKHFAKHILHKGQTSKNFSTALSHLRPSVLSIPSVLFTGLCHPLWTSVHSTAFSPLTVLSPSMALYPLCVTLAPLQPLSPQQPSVFSMGPWPYVPSTALCLFNGPLSPLRPCVPSTALCPF
jgi:hypothetical protein